MSTCMYCGAQLAPGALGCGRCGRPVAQQQQQAPWPQQAQPPYAQQPPPAWQQPPPPAPSGVEWKWGYSRWVGIHYGPIPVGIIIALIVLAAYSSSR